MFSLLPTAGNNPHASLCQSAVRTDETGDLLHDSLRGGIQMLQMTFTAQWVVCYDWGDMKEVIKPKLGTSGRTSWRKWHQH